MDNLNLDFNSELTVNDQLSSLKAAEIMWI